MTPCSRPENLSKIKETIPNQCTWVVLYDQSVGNDVECISDVCFYSENTGHYGNPLRNEFLNLFSDKLNSIEATINKIEEKIIFNRFGL